MVSPEGGGPGDRPRQRNRWWSAWLAAVLAFLAKGKAILFLLFKVKFLLSFVSLVVTSFIYGLAFGWAFGVGFIALLFVHEMGHVIALKRRGIPAPAPVFIPFVGAAIVLRQHPQSAADEAYVAAGGPLLGWVASAVTYLLFVVTGHPLFETLAYFGFFLQAFNLVPVTPLDGGRIIAAVDRRLWWFGLPLLAAVILLTHSVFGILIGVLIAYQFFQRLRRPEDPAYFDVPRSVKVAAFAAWLILLALSLGGMVLTGGASGWA